MAIKSHTDQAFYGDLVSEAFRAEAPRLEQAKTEKPVKSNPQHSPQSQPPFAEAAPSMQPSAPMSSGYQAPMPVPFWGMRPWSYSTPKPYFSGTYPYFVLTNPQPAGFTAPPNEVFRIPQKRRRKRVERRELGPNDTARMPDACRILALSENTIRNRYNPKSKYYDPLFPIPSPLNSTGKRSAIGWRAGDLYAYHDACRNAGRELCITAAMAAI